MAAYDSYGQQAQQQQPASNRDALLYLLQQQRQQRAAPQSLTQPRNDFPNLGGISPAAAAPSGPPASSTSPVSSPGTVPPVSGAAGLSSIVTNPSKYASINFDQLGNRDYLSQQPGGAFWTQQNGPAPPGWEWDSNGQPKKISGWDKLQNVVDDTTIAGLTGGTGAATLAPAIAGSVAGNLYTSARPQGYQGGSQGAAPSALAPSTGAAGTTPTTAAATPGAGVTLPDTVDTNGYAKPGYAVKGAATPLAGYDSTKWNDPNHQSPKYVVGRILSQYPQTTDGLKQAMAEIQKAYPGATQNGDDTISIPGVSTSVDVVKAGGGFWWNPETDANGNPYPKDSGGDGGGGGADLSGGYNAMGDLSTSNVIARIIAQLGGAAGGQGAGAGPLSARNAILGQLGL